MEDKLRKLSALKKSSREMSPVEKKAKMDVLGRLSGEMGSMLGDKLKGLKKVTVASNTPDGLEAGLDKAKSILGHKADEANVEHGMDPKLDAIHDMMADSGTAEPDEEDAEMDSHNEDPSPEEASEHEDSDEDIDSKIKELMAKKGMRNQKVRI